MSSSGIIRRVDDLGRIVLPRSLRKSLKIDVGTKLEINLTEDKNIILKKITELDDAKIYNKYVLAMSKIIENTIAIIDRDKVLASNKKSLIGKDVSNDIYDMIVKRDCIIKKSAEGAKMLPLFDGDIIDNYNCQLIVPIIRDGDTIGAIIVLCEGSACFDDESIKVCKSFAHLISIVDA